MSYQQSNFSAKVPTVQQAVHDSQPLLSNRVEFRMGNAKACIVAAAQ